MDEQKDIYNLPIAAFTFGKNGQPLSYYPVNDLKNIPQDNTVINKNKNESLNNNNYTIESKESRDSNKFSNDDSSKRFSFKNIINRNNKKKNINKINLNENLNNNINNNNICNHNFIFIDKEDNNSSYIKIILYAISYMQLFQNFIINEWNPNNNLDQENNNIEQILLLIRDILIKIERIKNRNIDENNNAKINNIINIEQLKENLSESFKTQNKFLKNFPDDPMDFLYIIFNSFHDLNPTKLKKKVCNECFCHKNISIVLYKLYECECSAQSKPILSNNNYILDIPINIIINKFLSNKLKDMNQMLFIFYQQLIQNIKIKGDCPIYGKNCKTNKVHKKYILKKCPSYLIFNLENDFFKNKEIFCSLNNILKTFILIPHIFNINSLFDLKQKNAQNKYELIGILFLKISKIYSCIFKSKEIFYYYEENTFISFDNYYDIILFSLKNGNTPIALIYQKINDNNEININYELTEEKINNLEKYVKNTNNLNQNLKNKIRTRENIIADNFDINYSINNKNSNSYSENYTSSRYSNSIKSYNSYQKNEYICNNCERINKIENAICFFCGNDNSILVNNINKNISNQNIKKLKNNIIFKKKISLKSEKISKTQNNINNNELGEIEDEYKIIEPQVQKYFDMSHSNISSKKDNNNDNNNIIQKQKLSSKHINKIPHEKNINLNNFKTEKKTTNLSITNSPKIDDKNLDINNLRNQSLKAMNKSAKNGFINYTNRNNNKNELNNMDKNNFHSQQGEQYNNQLNINLKINNNNNFNIFEFGDKKNLIKLNEYNKYETEENYFNVIKDKKLFKKMNNTKNKDKNKLNTKKIINYNIPNDNWICIYCLNKNDNNSRKCVYCKKKRTINNINKSPRNKSIIINENRINFNNMLIGQMSTKNTNRLSKI